MNEKDTTEAEGLCRLQSSLLSKFQEVAQSFLTMSGGERGNKKAFAALQDYLDGSELVDGAYCRRRTVLLAIHDMKEDREAPASLQNKTLALLRSLDIRPLPPVKCYRDIATALLRLEVVIRLEAMQTLVQASSVRHSTQSSGRMSAALGQNPTFEPAQKAPRHIPN